MPVVLAFERGSGPIAGLIRYRTWGRWSHVAIVDPDDPRYVLESIVGKGVVRQPRRAGMQYVAYPGAPKTVYELSNLHRGKSYAYTDIMGYLFRSKRWQHDDKWFCSELLAWAFQESGYPVVRSEAYKVSPEMLYAFSGAVDIRADQIPAYLRS